MKPSRRTTILAIAVLWGGLGLTGCQEDGGEIPREPTSAASLVTGPPHFEGDLPITLQSGTRAFVDPPCSPDPDRHRVCYVDESESFVTYSEPRSTELVDAAMAPTEDHTRWVVTLTFADRRAVRFVARQAETSGGLMLLLYGDQVLLTHQVRTLPERSVRGATLTLTPSDKAFAWGLIERFIDRA